MDDGYAVLITDNKWMFHLEEVMSEPIAEYPLRTALLTRPHMVIGRANLLKEDCEALLKRVGTEARGVE